MRIARIASRGVWLLAAVVVVAVILARADGHGVPVDVGSAVRVVGATDGSAARSTERVPYGDALRLEAAYVVRDGVLVDANLAPEPHRAAWDIARAIFPPSVLTQVRQLDVVTDGPRGTLAMVHRSGVATDQWIVSIDTAEPHRVLRESLVHELAHVLTLRSEDLSTSGDCDGVRLALGCARDGSALAAWAEAFWPDPTTPATYDPTAFVSTYAATAVQEDLAESFLAYVNGERGDGPIVAAKLAFFDTRPELAAAAADVRQRLSAASS
ncbi:MAG TPA: hypothetical protein VF183_15615 [Acidimicrobiales bacterium]